MIFDGGPRFPYAVAVWFPLKKKLNEKEVIKMDMADLGNLGNTIRRLRIKRNWTLKELSDKTGIQPATISRMENGKMIGTLDAFNALAEAFGMKLSELFKECEKDQSEADDMAVMEAFINEKEVFPEVSISENLN